jgi:anti-sigma B factor antagonist
VECRRLPLGARDPAPGVRREVGHRFGREELALSVSGELDLVTAPQLTESIDAVITEHTPAALIIDLTGVPFLASMGMTVLVQTCERLGRTTRFAVVADGPATSRPLTMMGLDDTFALYSDLGSAVTALAS